MSSMTKQAGSTKLVRLNVKIGARYVYLNPQSEELQKGGSTDGRLAKPVSAIEFITPLPKNVQRKIRRALDAAGYRGIAKGTVPPAQLSFAKLTEYGPYLSNFTNKRDAEQTLHDDAVAKSYAEGHPTDEEIEYSYHRYAMGGV